MGRVRGPYPQKKLRNLKDYSIPSKRATFFEGPTPLGPPSERPNIDENLSKMKNFFRKSTWISRIPRGKDHKK